MTEDEAKTRWCPFVRLVGWNGQPAGHNRVVGDPSASDPTFFIQGHANCIGSACMAWRTMKGFSEVPISPETADCVARVPTLVGFCGLAGAPQ